MARSLHTLSLRALTMLLYCLVFSICCCSVLSCSCLYSRSLQNIVCDTWFIYKIHYYIFVGDYWRFFLIHIPHQVIQIGGAKSSEENRDFLNNNCKSNYNYSYDATCSTPGYRCSDENAPKTRRFCKIKCFTSIFALFYNFLYTGVQPWK